MPRIKIGFTVIVILLALVLCTIDRGRLRWLTDPGVWRGGEHDPLRFLMFDGNGKVRRTGILAIYAILLAAIWLLA